MYTAAQLRRHILYTPDLTESMYSPFKGSLKHSEQCGFQLLYRRAFKKSCHRVHWFDPGLALVSTSEPDKCCTTLSDYTEVRFPFRRDNRGPLCDCNTQSIHISSDHWLPPGFSRSLLPSLPLCLPRTAWFMSAAFWQCWVAWARCSSWKRESRREEKGQTGVMDQGREGVGETRD